MTDLLKSRLYNYGSALFKNKQDNLTLLQLKCEMLKLNCVMYVSTMLRHTLRNSVIMLSQHIVYYYMIKNSNFMKLHPIPQLYRARTKPGHSFKAL